MRPISPRDLRHAVLGRVDAPLPADAPPVRAVCTDTRAPAPDSAFFALRGDRHDGHDHVAAAFAAGAVLAVVERPVPAPPGKFVVEVPDVRRALGRLANHVRRGMKAARVVAVAGSNGKTSTKGLIHAALSARLTGTASPASFNNDVGVPLTFLQAAGTPQYVVAELGTNAPGEIETLSRIAEPDIAVLTGAGEEHLEGLGDIGGVRRENAQIACGMDPAKGLIVCQGDDAELLKAVKSWWNGRVLTFGFDPHNDLFAADVEVTAAGTSFSLNGSRRRLTVPQVGRFVASNALAAVAVARRLGLDDDAVAGALARAEGPPMRMRPLTVNGGTVLVDCYNANPASMRAALAALSELPCAGKRIAVLGDMLELGPAAPALHEEVALGASALADAVHLIGPLFAATTPDAARHPDPASAPAIVDLIGAGDLVLLKGSRGLRLERLLPPTP